MLERFFGRKKKEEEKKESSPFLLHHNGQSRVLDFGEWVFICEKCGPEDLSIHLHILPRADAAISIQLNWEGRMYHSFEWGIVEFYKEVKDPVTGKKEHLKVKEFGHLLTDATLTHEKNGHYSVHNTPLSFSADFKKLYLNNQPFLEWNGE
jgi:hypothetical protein